MARLAEYMGSDYALAVRLTLRGLRGVSDGSLSAPIVVWTDLRTVGYCASINGGDRIGPFPTEDALYVALKLLQS